MSLISILVPLFLLGLFLWVLSQFEIDPTVRKVIHIVVVVFLVLWVLQVFLGYPIGMGNLRLN